MTQDNRRTPGRIILLNGASSSGKSTIARALQAQLGDPFWHISIDHLRDAGVLPLDRIRSGEFAWSEMREAFFLGFERSLAAYTSAGNDLIVEYIVETREWMDSARPRPGGNRSVLRSGCIAPSTNWKDRKDAWRPVLSATHGGTISPCMRIANTIAKWIGRGPRTVTPRSLSRHGGSARATEPAPANSSL